MTTLGREGRSMADGQDDLVSEAGDDYRSQAEERTVASGSTVPRGANVRAAVAGNVLSGRGPIMPDRRKFRYDVTRARSSGLKFEVTRDDRMAAVEAGNMLDKIHRMWGIAGENEDLLHAHDNALWVVHSVNGASVLNPGRAKYAVTGRSKPFDYGEVVKLLGVDLRRFFRAFADDITEANKAVLAAYDPYDEVSVELHGWLNERAHVRGLSRFPHLVHDSADACVRLTIVERQALLASKSLVVSSTPNSADRVRPLSKVESADRYDSTVGESYH